VAGGRAQLASDAGIERWAPDASVVSRMFSPGDGDALALAKVVAAFGRFSLRHLELAARLTNRPPQAVSAAFDRLVSDHVLIRDDDGGYAFAHAIIRDALYEQLGPAERRRLHGAIAQVLSEERRGGVLLDVAQLATHVAASADPGDDHAITVLLDAGRIVEATAPLVAARHYGQAVRLLPVDSPRRASTLALQARSLYVGSRPLEAAGVGREALELLGPGPVRRATVSIVVNGLNIAGRVAEALEVVQAEIPSRPEDCSLLAQRAHLLLSTGNPAQAAARVPEALAALEAAEGPELVAATHLLIYAMDTGNGALATAMLDRLERVADSLAPDRARAAHETIAFACWLPGFSPTVDRHLTAAQALRSEGTGLSIAGNYEVALVNQHLLAGRWDEALELCHSLSFDFEQRGAATVVCLLRALACEMLIHRGELDAAAALAQELSAPTEELRSAVEVCRARVLRALGNPEGAARGLSAQEERARAKGVQLRRAEVLAELAELALEQGREEQAARFAADLDELAQDSARFEPRLIRPYVHALLRRDVAAAREYLEVAERERVAFERARARLVLGELDDEPESNLLAAYQAFDALAAGPWRRRAASALRERGLRVPRPARRSAGGLTEAEERLVRLVADGLTNRQIATAMHYSEKTVEVYLSRVYAKTGYGSRVKLVQAVAAGSVLGADHRARA
jgi:DNA-binding CsgD family transcriptional regulator